MKLVVNFLNWLTDMDLGWWPLLKYRPAKDEVLDFKILLKITPIFGTIAALIAILLTGEYREIPTIISIFIFCWLLFFFGYRCTFSVAWNIRAKKLNKKNGDSAV